MFERMACNIQISCESVVSDMSLLDMMLDVLGDGTAKRCDMEDPSNVHAPCREPTFPPWAAEVVAGCSGKFANPVKQQTKVVGGQRQETQERQGHVGRPLGKLQEEGSEGQVATTSRLRASSRTKLLRFECGFEP